MLKLAQLVIVALLTIGPHLSAQTHNSQVRKSIQKRGYVRQLGPQGGIAMIFLGTECPISQKYLPVLETMKAELRDSILFILIIPERLSKRTVLALQEKYNSTIPFILDKRQKLAKKMSAKLTPEAFLLNNENNVIYHGAIDNWFYQLGRNRPKTTESYLLDAIRNYLNKKPITNSFVPSTGCLIQF
jgi:thiol-disulfide isomerase/thioredoxin